jgi:hypothetical protein
MIIAKAENEAIISKETEIWRQLDFFVSCNSRFPEQSLWPPQIFLSQSYEKASSPSLVKICSGGSLIVNLLSGSKSSIGSQDKGASIAPGQ